MHNWQDLFELGKVANIIKSPTVGFSRELGLLTCHISH